MKIEAPLEALRRMGCSDKCYIRRECPQNPSLKSIARIEPSTMAFGPPGFEILGMVGEVNMNLIDVKIEHYFQYPQ